MLNRMIRLMMAAFAMVLMTVPAGDAMAQAYELKPGDIVEITVLEDPSLNRRVLIGPDGAISLPLAGSVQAGGSTLNTLQTGIASRLRGQFVNPPSVTVSLVALGPETLDPSTDDEGVDPEEEEAELRSFYVLGEVARPGHYEFEPDSPINILQALAIAGGPGVFAARSRIQVRSRVPDPNALPPAPEEAEQDTADASKTENAAAAPSEDGAAASSEDNDAPPPTPVAMLEELRLFDYAAVEAGDPESTLMFVRDGDVIVVPERGLFE